MTARGRLYYQYFKNRNGSLKEEEKIYAKQIDMFLVKNYSEEEIPDCIYFLTYTLDNGVSFRINFMPDSINIDKINETDDVENLEQSINMDEEMTLIIIHEDNEQESSKKSIMISSDNIFLTTPTKNYYTVINEEKLKLLLLK